nr:replication factor A protein 1-like [Ipomoea batatas]
MAQGEPTPSTMFTSGISCKIASSAAALALSILDGDVGDAPNLESCINLKTPPCSLAIYKYKRRTLALFTPVEQYECGWCEVMKYLHYVDKRLVRAKSVSSTMRRVVEIHSPVEKLIAGKPSRLMDFLIQDNEERQLKCTIWDDHVDAMLPYFNSTEPEPVIVLIQLCRAKTVNGEVRITSSYDATKLWFNHYCPEFTEFKAKLTKENTPMKSISTNSMVSQTTALRDFISGSVVITTISDLYQQIEEVVDVPTELESLIGKAMVFKVNIKKDYKQNYGSAFGVMKILNDENIVAAYCSSFGVDQEKDLISKMLEDYGNEYSEDDESGGDEVNSPNNIIKPRQQEVEQEMSPLSKRSLLDQFSSTQQMKKGRLEVIKKEKIV